MALPAPLLLPLLLPAEKMINTALLTDDISRNRLSELNDKVIVIKETRFEITVGIAIVSNAVQLLNEFDGDADVTLIGEYASLAALITSSDALYGSGIRIEGELSVAETLRGIVGQLDIDAESLLAPITGGTIAHQAGRFLKNTAAWLMSTSEKVQLNTTDYLQEEINVLVHPVLAKEFNDEVTDLREGVDRIEARLRRLEIASDIKSKPGKSL